MMLMRTSVPRPTDPGLRSAGGSGLDAIWWAASVMPYASSTGAPNAASRSCITCGGSDALHERMKRSVSAPAGLPEPPGRRARQQQLVQRRHRRVPGHAVIARDAPERQRAELRRHDDRAAGGERRQRRRHQAVHVEQRHHAQRHVVGRERVAARDVAAPRSTGWRASAARAWAGPVLPLVCSTSATSSTAGGVDGVAGRSRRSG